MSTQTNNKATNEYKAGKYVSIDGCVRVSGKNIPEGEVFELDAKDAKRMSNIIITEAEYKAKVGK